MEYLDQLNEQQQEAVLYNEGPSLVVAGAGSGKTRVLTYKVAHLIKQGMPPYHILALTFTNKAAREMKNRIAALTDESVTQQLWMGTFHAIFYRILRYEADAIGYPHDFTIYDTSDSRSLIRNIVKEMQLDDKDYRAGMIQSRISNAKNALVTCAAYGQNREYAECDQKARIPLFGEIYKRYQARCFQAGAMDFDEILLQTNILFRDHLPVLEKYQHKFRFVLVDEYQDTNFAQHLIVTRLCEQNRRICVVGDDAQSIYSFRGANIDNMLRFKDNYPDCRIFKLEQNYRSTKNIVDAANSLIHKNKGQIPKNVYSCNESGSKIRVLSSYSDYEEGYMISSLIADAYRKQEGCAYSDFAVLYRTNAQSRVIEDALRSRGIAYKVYGSQSFYQRKEIKDVIAYFRMVVNPHDEEALKRVINFPARGLGETTVNKLLAAASTHRVSVWTVICSPAAYDVALHAGTLRKLTDFAEMIQELIDENSRQTAVDMAERIVKRSGIAALFFQDRTVEGISRQENLQEVLKAIAEFSDNKREEGAEQTSLTDFLVEVSLITDQDQDANDQADKITLMTVHAAKGLEFDNIIIAGMEDNLFPSLMAMADLRSIEEERRLFYVAITRARKHCTITHAQSRFRNGQTASSAPSRFLNDIDPQYLEVEIPEGQIYTRKPVKADRYGTSAYYPRETRTLQPLSSSQNRNTPHGGQAETWHTLDGFSVGDNVRHDRFGEGVILALEGRAADAKATISFAHLGKKCLLLKYARLTKY